MIKQLFPGNLFSSTSLAQLCRNNCSRIHYQARNWPYSTHISNGFRTQNGDQKCYWVTTTFSKSFSSSFHVFCGIAAAENSSPVNCLHGFWGYFPSSGQNIVRIYEFQSAQLSTIEHAYEERTDCENIKWSRLRYDLHSQHSCHSGGSNGHIKPRNQGTARFTGPNIIYV